MSTKNSPKEQIRSFTLSIPSVLNTKPQNEIITQVPRSIEFPMRKMSETTSLPSIITARKRIESFDVSSVLLYEGQAFKRSNSLKNVVPNKVLDFLPYIYAQNGYEKTREMYTMYFGRGYENSLPLQRKVSSLNILGELRESRAKMRPSKEDLTHKNRSFDSV
ncbi:unnamed protein product [Blepharisma stoltei]|uniref:Uncharacterized protein n=1 Tax=Blepharisma stoltei TaxID=1481888 RepID=A0AAU9J7I1_9CILI|nr:unnamed protein product [Blepharisma stoltei]